VARLNHRLLLWQAISLLTLPLACIGIVYAQWELGFSASAEVASNSLPATDINGDWRKGVSMPSSRSYSFGEKLIEVYAKSDSGWRIAALQRAQVGLETTPDVVKFYSAYRTNRDPNAATSFLVGIASRSWAANGLSVSSPSIELGEILAVNWKLTPNLQLLQLQTLQVIGASGAVSFDGVKEYGFVLQGERSGANVNAPFLIGNGSSGVGTSFSLKLDGKLNDRLNASLSVADAFSVLRWANQKSENFVVNSNAQTRNADGTINYGAIVNGNNNLRTLSTSAYSRVSLTLDYRVAHEQRATFEATHIAGLSKLWFGYRSATWQVAIDPISRSLRIGVNALGCGLLVAGDSIDKAAQNRMFGMNCRYVF
jgi:hypothetical protein